MWSTWTTGQGGECRLTVLECLLLNCLFRYRYWCRMVDEAVRLLIQAAESLKGHMAERLAKEKEQAAFPAEVAAGHHAQAWGCRQLVSVVLRELPHSCQLIKVSAPPCSPSEGDRVLLSELLQAEWLLLIECAQKMVVGNWIRVALLVHLCNMLCLLTIWLEWLELVKEKVFPTVEFWELSTC